jgi:phosphatidylinositol alpha-1,6-mannosyltransferase
LSRPRLLLISPDFPPQPGGIQVMAHRLACDMRGFQTRVVAVGDAHAGSFDRSSGVSVRRARVRNGSRHVRLAALNAAVVQEGLRFKPNAMLGMHIVTSPATAALRGLLHIPTVQYFHAKEIPDKRRLSVFAAARADAVIVVSAYTRALLEQAGASPGRLELIPPGVDLPPAVAAERTESPTVLTIARLENRYKGHDVLARAMVRVRDVVPGARWVVIGDGALRGELEALVRSLGVEEAVSFLGSVSDDQRDEWLRRCDVFAMPSRLSGEGRAGEGFGIVYLEAGAHAKPVVAGRAAGALDSVLDGETGLLVDPEDPAAVGDAIARLLCDPQLAQALGDAGALRARDFAWAKIAARVEALLLEQLPAHARQPGRAKTSAHGVA